MHTQSVYFFIFIYFCITDLTPVAPAKLDAVLNPAGEREFSLRYLEYSAR